ncbi:hypothetical protein M0805_006120 [Coniferiporia weirii]|nr:hypothetical protein M0805_006120 [Coniferiporia weirii]
MRLHAFPLTIPFFFSVFSYARMHVARAPPAPRQLGPMLPRSSDCFDPDPQNTLTDRMNVALNSSNSGYVLSLCPNTEYRIEAPIAFTFPNQEISTQGYPTDDSRATLVVNGTIVNGTGQSTAIDGTCSNCNGVILRNIQIDGSREGTIIDGGANIEMGGDNSGQLVEFVHSFNPRSWSCLHIAEGTLKCSNITVQNNDIGPCGNDAFNQWADGISFSCANGIVRNNLVNNPTDGGIVLFGSPGTIVENNTIWVEQQTLLGGINMVDFSPWSGNYTGVVVQNNSIYGGFATDNDEDVATKGDDQFDAIIKIGIAIGPRTWFGTRYGNNKSENAVVINNNLSGAFGYGIAMTSAHNFTVEGNVLFGNTSFIGSRGPNCSSVDTTPTTHDFVIEQNTTVLSTTQSDFQNIADGSSLTCIEPPTDGDFWPYGGNPEGSGESESGGSSKGRKVGLALGITFGIIFVAALAWFIRRWALARQSRFRTGARGPSRSGFTRKKF